MDYCSQLVQASSTPLHGTASQFRVALLLEYGGEWRNKAINNNDLPAEVTSWLDGITASVPGSRPLFICRNERRRASGSEDKTFYVTVNDVDAPRVYRFSFVDYAELFDLDVAAIVAGTSGVEPVDETVIAVCTNGKHDLCCAKFGRPVSHAFEEEFRDEPEVSVWQCTHIGGHRYAATAVVLPSGVVYGYLSPDNVPTVAEAVRAEQIHLPCYRGRTLYSGIVNAAEYYVRDATGQAGLNAFSLISSGPVDNDGENEAWRVEFKNGSAPHHIIELSQTMTEPQISSCGDKPLKVQAQYRLQNHHKSK